MFPCLSLPDLYHFLFFFRSKFFIPFYLLHLLLQHSKDPTSMNSTVSNDFCCQETFSMVPSETCFMNRLPEMECDSSVLPPFAQDQEYMNESYCYPSYDQESSQVVLPSEDCSYYTSFNSFGPVHTEDSCLNDFLPRCDSQDTLCSSFSEQSENVLCSSCLPMNYDGFGSSSMDNSLLCYSNPPTTTPFYPYENQPESAFNSNNEFYTDPMNPIMVDYGSTDSDSTPISDLSMDLSTCSSPQSFVCQDSIIPSISLDDPQPYSQEDKKRITKKASKRKSLPKKKTSPSPSQGRKSRKNSKSMEVNEQSNRCLVHFPPPPLPLTSRKSHKLYIADKAPAFGVVHMNSGSASVYPTELSQTEARLEPTMNAGDMKMYYDVMPSSKSKSATKWVSKLIPVRCNIKEQDTCFLTCNRYTNPSQSIVLSL